MTNDLLTVEECAVCDGGRLFVAPTSARDLVALEGSVHGGPNMLPAEHDVLPALAAALLDAGTLKRSKAAIREALAARGITIGFAASGDRTYFSGQCFPEDLEALLAALCECLSGAAFPEGEVANVKALSLGSLAEEKSDTRAQAERALAAHLYDPTHVNYARPVQDEERSVRLATRTDLLEFKKGLGVGGLVIAIAGDVTSASARAAVEKTFGKLGKGTTSVPVKHSNTKLPTAGESVISIADKANVDVLLGVALPLTMYDERYHAMKVLVEMLGGGFTSHLMQTIRERDGLTYGVYARLAGLESGADGSFKIWASFSPGRYAESVAKLREEVARFFARGLTPTALTLSKERMAGLYLVSLSTTQNLASALHSVGVQGRELAYLTAYPDLIRAVSIADLKRAAAMIPLDKLSLVAAGTL
ncbi:MAG: pitrilysin family protein [Candidatus Paceibacterota bacterium]